MAVRPELLDLLVCPKCHSDLDIDDAHTELACVNDECALVYPIRDDIPVMIIEEAVARAK